MVQDPEGEFFLLSYSALSPSSSATGQIVDGKRYLSFTGESCRAKSRLGLRGDDIARAAADVVSEDSGRRVAGI